MKHFDLDFPGGPPGKLAAAISKATGKQLNLIIPIDYADTPIMPIKVVGVTVPELFSAIGAASNRDVPVVTARTSGGGKNISYRISGVNFTTTSQLVSDETVWSFRFMGPSREEELLGAPEESQPVCKYFQLAPYLLDHTVEDITTAIQTGWKMLKAEPVPQLSFHEETKLLIAVGSAPYVDQIPKVLEQLTLDGDSGMAKIAKWQQQLAEIQTKKEDDWEKRAQELRDQIEQFTIKQLQKARAK